MKFNLKNRPKPKIIAKYGDGSVCYDKTITDFKDWFEGFEKELQKLLHDFPDMDDSKYWVKIKETKRSKAFNSLMYIADVLFWKDKFEKEILGDEQK